VELDGEAELQHGAAMADAAQALIRPRVGSNELGNGRRRWRARWSGLGCEESERSGEKWPGRSPATALLELSSTRTREEGERDDDEKPPTPANG